MFQHNSSNLFIVLWVFQFLFAGCIQQNLIFRHWEIQSCHSGWWIRVNSQRNIFRSHQSIDLPLKNQKALVSPACCSSLIPQRKNTDRILRVTDPLANYFWLCLRSCPAIYVLSKNVTQNEGFASCCIVCVDSLLKQNKPRT